MGRKPKKTAEKTDYASLSDRQRRILNVISDAVMLRGYPQASAKLVTQQACSPPPLLPTS